MKPILGNTSKLFGLSMSCARTLIGRSFRSSSNRSSLSHLKSRAMSSIYVLPLDPAAQQSAPVADVSPSELWSLTPSAAASKPASVGTTHVFYGTPHTDKTNLTVVTSLGEGFEKKTGDARREIVRKAIGSAVKKAKAQGEGAKQRTIRVDAALDPHAAGEYATIHIIYLEGDSNTKRGIDSCCCPFGTLQVFLENNR